MNVHLVIPPCAFLIDDRAFPFLGPLQIAAVAREAGHEVRVSDLTGYKRRHPDIAHAPAEDVAREAIDQLGRELSDWKPDYVGFYSLAAQHPTVVRLLERAKESAPQAKTLLGGPHANSAPDRCRDEGFDHVIVADQGGGGGEPGFLRSLEPDAPTILREPSRIGVDWECDRWPLPARDLIDLPSYRYAIKGERATSMISTTGCPYACTYCSHWESYRKLEAKSAVRVAQELESIRRDYGIRAIMDYSDEINLRPDFVDEFLPMMKRSGFIWRAFFKNGKNLTRPEVFRAMAEAGCVQLCTGAESANAQILKDIKKGATREHNTAFVRYCVESGIEPKVFTQVGLPGETPESIVELRDWIVHDLAPIGLSEFDVSITNPYEGTPIYEEPEKHAITFDKEKVRLGLYKGVPGEYVSNVSHPRLSPEDLVKARQWVEDEGRKAIGLPPLMAKDDG